MRSKLKKFIPHSAGRKIRGVWQKTMALYYRGNKYVCPFCGYTFRKMLDGGFDHPVIREKQIISAGRRKNCVCPRCYSVDRDRLLYLFLKNKTDIFEKNYKMLHIAPAGALKALFVKLPNIKYTEGTKYHEGYYYSKDIALIDITNLNFSDNSFDIIFCNHVLEHVPDDSKALSELRRVMKPDGWAVLQVPQSKLLDKTYENPDITTEQERIKHFGQFDHVRLYGKDYPERLRRSGFDVEVHNPQVDGWNTGNFEKYAINPEEMVFIARKPADK